MSFWRVRITNAASDLFSHAPDPLAETFCYPGDPGLFGPGSITWDLMSDVAAFVGGIRALLVQAAHPEVAAGVSEHSAYREDPLGRLSRTAAYVTATTYGSIPEAESALAIVRSAHKGVRGRSHRKIRYEAQNPTLGSWVHNALIDSFLISRQIFGPSPITVFHADAYVTEQARLGKRLGISPLLSNAAELSEWITSHPELENSPAAKEAVSFLSKPNLPRPVIHVYQRLYNAAIATIPDRLKEILGLKTQPGSVFLGRATTSLLRTAMGSSPAWSAALERCDQPRPTGVRFRNPPGTTR